MNKKKIMLISLGILSIFFIISISMKIHRIELENLIVEESNFIAYFEQDKDLSNNIEKNLGNFITEEKELNKLLKNYRKINRNLQRFFILSLEDKKGINFSKKDFILVLDFGYRYPLGKFTMNRYFNKTPRGRVLREKYKADLVEKNILKESDDIFLLYYKSYYIISLSPDTLSSYKKKLKKNSINEKLVDNLSFKNMYALDFQKIARQNLNLNLDIDIILGEFNFNDIGHFQINNIVKFKEKQSLFNFKKEHNKNLDKFIQNKQGLYISNKDIFTFIISLFIDSHISKEGFGNINLEGLLDKFYDEIYIDLESRSAVIKALDINFFRFILNFIAQEKTDNTYIIEDKLKVLISDNYLFFNDKLEKTNFKTFKDNEFIYLNINTNLLFDLLRIRSNIKRDFNIEFTGKAQENNLKLNIELKAL